MHSLKISEVMWNHIEPIRCGTPLTNVVKALLSNHVTGLPVVDDQRRVLGMVSEQDCSHALLVSSYHSEGEPDGVDGKFQKPATVSPDMSLVDLAQNLGAGKPKVYPVVENGKLVGIVTRAAILSQLAKAGQTMERSRFADAED